MRRAILAMALLPGMACADPRWDQNQLLMYQDRTPTQMKGLPALGFTGSTVRASSGLVDHAGVAARLALGQMYYLENIATDFYSPYHRYFPGKPPTANFDALKEQLRRNPADRAVFVREPGLSDPVWLDRVRTRLHDMVVAEAPHHPLYYDLADESGIGDLAAAWDADIGPTSLAAMRTWLRTRYPSLAALNDRWGTAYTTWDAVEPELTDAALRRTDGNYAAWSDFKAWMDVAFARAVKAGADAVHAADPTALVGLEGGQVPGWGGYDYARLAPMLDVFEIYDYGDAPDLALAANPALRILRTSFNSGEAEAHAWWHSLLHGGRGTVVWDEADTVVNADGTPGLRGRELAALVAATKPIAPLLRHPAPDAVAVLLNQESFRLTWLLDRRAGDHDWAARNAEREYDDNAWRQQRRVVLQRLAAIGVQPRIVFDATALDPAIRVLILADAIALSHSDVASIRAFQARGGTVFATTEPGLFDGHGTRREALPLPQVAHPQPLRADDSTADPATLTALRTLLTQAGVTARVELLDPSGAPATGLDTRWFHDPRGTILAIQAATPGRGPRRLQIRFASPTLVTDLQQGAAAEMVSTRDVTLDPSRPLLLLTAQR